MTSAEWAVLNRERGDLINKKYGGAGLSPEEQSRLDELQVIADKHLEPFDRIRNEALERLERIVKNVESNKSE